MEKINRINVFAFAKFQAFLAALFGLIPAIMYSFGGTIFDIVNTGSVNFGTALAYMALPVMPIMFGVGGFILGIIEALLYNLFASQFGGIKIDFLR